MALILAVIAFVAFLVWFRVLNREKSPVINWPLLGNMLSGVVFNASRMHDYVCDVLFQSNHHTIRAKAPWVNFLITSDPKNFQYILSTNFANYAKGPSFKEMFEYLGDGIFVSDFDSWKTQRKLIHGIIRQPGFLKLVEENAQQKVEQGLFTVFDNVSNLGLVVDLQDLFQRFTFDVALMYLLGCNPNSSSTELPDVPFAIAFHQLEEATFHRHYRPRWFWKLQKWLQIGAEQNTVRATKEVDDFIYSHLERCRRSQISEEGSASDMQEDGSAIICNLMKCKEYAAEKSSDKFLRDFLINIIIAANDTTAVALTWFFWVLVSSPSIERKIHEEIRVTFRMNEGEKWRFPNFQELNKLVYLHIVFLETLRLYPPVPMNHKAANKPDILPSGHNVYKDDEILLSVYAMGRMEEIWGPDCCEFKPERWISDKGDILDVPSYMFTTFSAGPRICAGKDLFFREVKLVAAAIIWNYHFEMADVNVHCQVPALGKSVLLNIKNGLKVLATKKYM